MRARKSAAPVLATLAAAALSTVAAAPANAGPMCAGAGQPTVSVARLPGTALKGITVDPAGRAFVSDLVSGQVFRIDAPGAADGTVYATDDFGSLVGRVYPNGYEVPGGFDPDARTATP